VLNPTTSESFSSDQPLFALQAEAQNQVGGHGLDIATLDFAGGLLAARNHACVGPPTPIFRDRANGTSTAQAEETMRVVYDGAPPPPSNATVTFCWSITSNTYGDRTVPSLPTSGMAQNVIDLSFNGHTVFTGGHSFNVNSNMWTATGGFAGQTVATATASGMYTVVIPFATDFVVHVGGNSTSQSEARSGVGQFPVVNASAGFAVTFGISSITPGGHAVWRGQTWGGFCGDSGPLVPPNPLMPSPSPLVALGGAGLAIASRRRR
jgi:hypothetical protein